MSASLFFLGIIIAFGTLFLTLYLQCKANDYSNSALGRRALVTAVFGAVLAIIVFALAFCFKCPTHLLAQLKYDNVVVLECANDVNFARPIEQDKVIWQDVSRNCNGTFVTIIMAWDNEKSRDAYEKLVAADSR